MLGGGAYVTLNLQLTFVVEKKSEKFENSVLLCVWSGGGGAV